MGVVDLHHSCSISVMMCGVYMNYRSFLASSFSVTALFSITVTMSGFTVVTSEELAEIRNAGKAQAVDGASLLHEDIIPWATSEANEINDILTAIDSEGFEPACETYGVQKSQAFPCSFWVHVSGEVTSVDNSSRVGKVLLTDASGREVVILTGPVIPGSSLRDGYPEIHYSDFGDQNAFASLSDDMNQEVISIIDGVGEISPGDQLSSVGAYSTWDGMDASLQVVPVILDREGGE